MYLPEDVKEIIDTLYRNGHEAYAVGGCVRDMMLGRTPGDWDITTSAMPEETKALFARTFDTGIEHGTITVLLNGVGYEVTTYRIDGKYEDSRHPSEVEFTRNLREDLQRRDFTINAMAYNDREGIVDIFGGRDDLERKMIRCVGNAAERFGEDALRILRAIRFSAQLGFEIEEETQVGIQELAHTLEHISVERIQVEMVKLLISDNPDYIDMAYQLGVTKVILPEWDKGIVPSLGDRGESVEQQTLFALKYIEADKVLRLACLLYGTNENVAKAILRRWKFDNETMKQVSKLVGYRDYKIEIHSVEDITDIYNPELYNKLEQIKVINQRHVRRSVHAMGRELFVKHMAVKRAEIQGFQYLCVQQASAQQSSSQYHKSVQYTQGIRKALARWDTIEKIYEEIIEKNQCTTLKQLAVSGNDLLHCGVKQGREIGDVLQKLLELVIEEPKCNTKEYLLEEVKRFLS